MIDDSYPLHNNDDYNKQHSSIVKTTTTTTKKTSSLISLSKQTAAPRNNNKYLSNLNISTNHNNNDAKLKIDVSSNNNNNNNNNNDYPLSSLQSPCNNNMKTNKSINMNDDIPSIPLPLQNIIFQPSGSWIERKLNNNKSNSNNNDQSSSSSLYYSNNTYYTLTSYVPSGLTILCHSTIKCIDIHCVGVSLLKVIYYKDSNVINDNNNSPANKPNDEKFVYNNKKKKNIITVNEICLPSIDIDENDCYLPQRVSLALPYPCIKVDVLLLKRKLDFVSIMGIAAYASTVRSSSLSTPHK